MQAFSYSTWVEWICHMAFTTDSAASAPDFMSGGGQMGKLMRSVNWANSNLGEIEHWPQSLRTSISICLASRFPIVLYWGHEFTVLYNDAYSMILGSKHPQALGQRCRECWAEIWDTIGPMLNSVITTGEATWSNDLLLQLQRFGYTEECYFSFSFSPVRIESGAIGGVFTAVVETTERLIAERRLNTLRELAAHTANADSENEMCARATEILSKNRNDISFSVLYLLSADGNYFEPKVSTGLLPDHFLCNGKKELGRLESSLLVAAGDVLRSGKTSVLTDLQSLNLPRGIWKVVPSEAISLPVLLPGHSMPVGCFLVGLSPRKRLDQDYRVFLELCASQLASSLAAARAHQEDRKRADILAELDRAKTSFFSNVSHEFRTPLTLMVRPLEDALASEKGLTQEQRRNLEVAHRNSLRLLKLVNTLLDFSRIEAGRLRASYQPTNLASLTTELASMFRSAIDRAGLKLLVHCPSTTESAYVDREMWEKIVFNLLSNAFKFTFQGEIEVSLTTVGKSIELVVRDTGTGIPKEEIPHLFERFYRVENARGRSLEGSGIGLALVQELAKLHGGSVRAESKLNYGSQFIVDIPLGKDHLPADRIGAARTVASTGVRAEAYVQESLHWSAGSPDISDDVQIASLIPTSTPSSPKRKSQDVSRILLADDNADMLDYVRKLLSDRYEVVACSDGQAALERAQQERPDLILTDVMMPQMDGFELLRALREDKNLQSTPVILLSARAGEESRLEGLDAGADDFLEKPFSARELLARVASNLAMAKLRQDVKTLRGILLICSYCKKIAANPETWVDIENYVRRNSDAEFNHGVCPDCLRKEMRRLA